MSRRVFEYFFEPREFEPYFTDLFGRLPKSSDRPASRVPDEKSGPSPSPEKPIAKEDESADEVDDSMQSQEQESAPSATRTMIDPQDAARSPVVDSNDSRQANGQPRGRVRHFLSVSALGQFLYCKRAAILASELGDTHDIDERKPRLSYRPNYTLDQIEAALSNRGIECCTAMMTCFGLFLLLIYSVSVQHRPLFQFAFLFFFAAVFTAAWLAAAVISLVVQRRAAINAEAIEPIPSFQGIARVNWWSMLKCGFDIVDYDRPFRHPERPLEGNPPQVLERDSVRIPVIRSARLGDRDGELFPKHQIRLVAYAMLLETIEHVRVPYGLVFPRWSSHGLAMEITPTLRAKAIPVLEEFLQSIENSQVRRIEPRMPEQKSRCSGCDYGKPLQISENEIKAMRKEGKELLVLRRENGTAYHCQCGDRFGSAPPHRNSIKMRLAASFDENI